MRKYDSLEATTSLMADRSLRAALPRPIASSTFGHESNRGPKWLPTARLETPLD